MVVTYSPHREGGGTLHFPSPTHIRHGDPSSALAQLRRSLSRSPSKGPTFRLVASKSASPTPSPLSPPSFSPQKRAGSLNLLSNASVISPSPLGSPFPSNTRQSKPGARKLSPMRASSRSSSCQRSPVKRALSACTDNGNATPSSPSTSGVGCENQTYRSISPELKCNSDLPLIFSGADTTDTLLAPHHALLRGDKGLSYLADHASKSSPLKRSDGIMNLDQANLGSPSAKRRSLHLGSDFNIFDHEAAMSALTQKETSESSGSDAPSFLDHSSAFSSIPKRTSSLRKTTLQQRYEKPLFARPRASPDANVGFGTPNQTVLKGRQRMSMDNVVAPMARDSPFSSQGSLPSASVHPISQQRLEFVGTQPLVQRHPLSRTLTQSSSNSSVAEDSPTHIPIRQSEYRRPSVDFSKSLPVGAMRPAPQEAFEIETSGQSSSTQSSFATPENYKLAKPLPAAFMSTGLISKRNKDMTATNLDFQVGLANMPDTPCKRPTSMAAMAAAPTLEEHVSKPRQARHTLHSFGTPSTPFNPHVSRPTFGSATREVGIFGSSFKTGARRDSLVSLEGEDNSQSLSGKFDSQSSADFEVPPTPTKQVLGSSTTQAAYVIDRDHPMAGELETFEAESPKRDQYCKSLLNYAPGSIPLEDKCNLLEGSPSAILRFRNLAAVSSFSSRHLWGQPHSPTPLSRKSFPLPSSIHTQSLRTKPSPLSPASPQLDRIIQLSPHTPQESMLPPDPSGLTISARGESYFVQSLNDTSNNSSIFLPATPTAPRESFLRFGKRRSSITPMYGHAPTEIDACLTSKFDKVEIVGTGEFSQVFKVASKQDMKRSQSYFSLPTSRASPKTPLPDQVWAVKKARQPFIGPKDRKSKLQEVEVLKTLGHSDHTVQMFDSWEDQGHLYIQTEYCEEGSLDLFLDQVGRKARLDDFRIWKIMLELSLGLKHIHDCGFIHLDLKPANVLITFEGVLKIGDFGMATSWPAQGGIDGEGDREYIGPEILMGKFDKPADIFALGLIMLEIAGNVMLPDNGASWQRLRTGDMSDVPSLTWSSEASNIFRDSSGKPISDEKSFDDLYGLENGTDEFGSPCLSRSDPVQESSNPKFKFLRSGELANPPNFMVDPNHEEALDTIVRWMISPEPSDRPVVDQILATGGVQWAGNRRRAGATIYEGNWGPADEVLQDDSEMIDV